MKNKAIALHQNSLEVKTEDSKFMEKVILAEREEKEREKVK